MFNILAFVILLQKLQLDITVVCELLYLFIKYMSFENYTTVNDQLLQVVSVTTIKDVVIKNYKVLHSSVTTMCKTIYKNKPALKYRNYSTIFIRCY